MKKIILFASAAMIAAVSLTFAFSSQNKSNASLLLQNVEALAAYAEGPHGPTICNDSFMYRQGSMTRFCGTCTFIHNAEPTTTIYRNCQRPS